MNPVEEYIAGFPEEIQQRLQQIREAIREAAPDAREIISYGMPAYKYHGMLAYFAAHNNHIGFYPTASPILAFQEDLKEYRTSRGTVQLPHSMPIPEELIKKIVMFKMGENLEKEVRRKARRTR